MAHGEIDQSPTTSDSGPRRPGAAVLLVLVLGLVAGSCSSSDSKLPAALPKQGRAVWELEGLLRKEYPTGSVWAFDGTDFRCRGDDCVMRPGMEEYTFVFPPHLTSTYSLSDEPLDGVGDPYVTPVRVKGHPVACDANQFLARDEMALSPAPALECLPQRSLCGDCGPTSTTSTTRPLRTQQIYIEPVLADGRLAPGYSVTATYDDGSCDSSLRCLAAGGTYDWCFRESATSGVCPTDPWATELTRVRSAEPIPEPLPGDDEGPDYWGLEVAGERCVRFEGARSTISEDDPRAIAYYCSRYDQRPYQLDLVLLDDDVDTSHDVWTIPAARVTPAGYEPLPEPMPISTAWVINPPGSRPSSNLAAEIYQDR